MNPMDRIEQSRLNGPNWTEINQMDGFGLKYTRNSLSLLRKHPNLHELFSPQFTIKDLVEFCHVCLILEDNLIKW